MLLMLAKALNQIYWYAYRADDTPPEIKANMDIAVDWGSKTFEVDDPKGVLSKPKPKRKRSKSARFSDQAAIADITKAIEGSVELTVGSQRRRLNKIETMSSEESLKLRTAIGRTRHELRLMERICREFDDA